MLLCLGLSGYGFHLRGMVDMPEWVNNVAIVNQTSSRDLTPQLTQQLEAYRIQVNPDAALAHYWLILEQDEIKQQVASISSSTTPRQNELIYTVLFKLQKTQGRELIPSTQIAVTRLLTINSDRILGSMDEEEHLKNEMRRDAIRQIINRLSRVHEH